jgi:hypothetical protein
VRRERYVGPWLPEPLVEPASAQDPAERVTLDESVSMALLVVLERLTPAERTSFLLHDVFGLSFAAHHGARGAWRVARAMHGMAQRPPHGIGMVTVNGAPGLVLRDADGVLSVISFTVDAGRITAIDVVRNPDKLSGVREPGGPGPAGHA